MQWCDATQFILHVQKAGEMVLDSTSVEDHCQVTWVWNEGDKVRRSYPASLCAPLREVRFMTLWVPSLSPVALLPVWICNPDTEMFSSSASALPSGHPAAAGSPGRQQQESSICASRDRGSAFWSCCYRSNRICGCASSTNILVFNIFYVKNV